MSSQSHPQSRFTRSNIRNQDTGNQLGECLRGGVRLRGTRSRGRATSRRKSFVQSRGARLTSYHSSEEEEPTNSDDSTQPPSQPWVPPCVDPVPPPFPNREPSQVDTNEDLGIPHTAADVPTEPVANQQQRKRTRGPAKCTLFERMRKSGKVHLKINDGETTPCCENASMFTSRVSWIIKQNCDMSYARWSAVPQAQKEELIARVKSDFVFDWERENHRLTVSKQLRKRFNSFHHDLHKIYLSYGSHEEALANGTSLVDPLVWVKLCERWGSGEFKKMSAQNRENRKCQKINHTSGRKSFVRILEQKRAGNNSTNMIDFYKETRWSKKKNAFVTADTEETYKKMQRRMDGLEPEQRTNEVAATVFREVLGHRSGYARGLGEMVIPESSRQRDQLKMQQYLAEIERQKQDAEQQRKDAEQYKSQLEEMRAEMRDLREQQIQTNRMLQTFFKGLPGFTESFQQTQGATNSLDT